MKKKKKKKKKKKAIVKESPRAHLSMILTAYSPPPTRSVHSYTVENAPDPSTAPVSNPDASVGCIVDPRRRSPPRRSAARDPRGTLPPTESRPDIRWIRLRRFVSFKQSSHRCQESQMVWVGASGDHHASEHMTPSEEEDDDGSGQATNGHIRRISGAYTQGFAEQESTIIKNIITMVMIMMEDGIMRTSER
jgi:hypothetical protein